jgi:hypothetical protein
MSKPREPMAGTEAQVNAEVNEGSPVTGPVSPSEPSALERTADLTRRILAVPKDQVPKHKPKKRRKAKKPKKRH